MDVYKVATVMNLVDGLFEAFTFVTHDMVGGHFDVIEEAGAAAAGAFSVIF